MASSDLKSWRAKHVLKGGYSSYLNDKYHNFIGLDKALDEIRAQVVDTLQAYERIAEENERLSDENWKDEELQKMKEQMEAAKENMYLGFPISKKETEAIKEWENKHWEEQHNAKTLEQRLNKMGAIGGSFYYKFVPTSIGTVGCVCCSACMDKARRNSGNNAERLEELIKEYDAEFEFQSL